MSGRHPDGWEMPSPFAGNPDHMTDARLAELVSDDDLDDETRDDLAAGVATQAELRTARIWALERRSRT